MAKYEVVVFSKDGRALGNIFSMCKNFKWSKTRCEAESVTFDLDLDRYEEYIQAIGFSDNPSGFLETGRSDIRLKRNGQWLLGVNVIKFGYSGGESGVTMKVSCTGYLNYYKKRYLDINYNQVPQHLILWGVINSCNQKPGGDYGIRQGTHQGKIVLRDRQQVRKEIKSFFQQMSQVINGPEYEFTYDKKLNTYDAMGAYRPDIRLSYPGNISGWDFERSVENVSNFIYGVGSGNGDDAAQSESEDSFSQSYLYRREQILTYNSIVDKKQLQENIDAVRHYTAQPIELPNITVENEVLDLNTVSIGDVIQVEMTGNKSLAHINGSYRIESIACSVDDNGAESVSLTFDDIDVSQIIAMQEANNAA